MSLKQPTAEDQRKIHAEVNQLVNQRFLLTTLAITVFGVGASWIFPKEIPHEGVSANPTLLGGAILLILQLALYFLHHYLAIIIRTLTTYLIVTKSSEWEAAWALFRKEKYFMYTHCQTIVFIVINLLSFLCPIAVICIYSLKVNKLLLFLNIIIMTISICFMLFFGLFKRSGSEVNIEMQLEKARC